MPDIKEKLVDLIVCPCESEVGEGAFACPSRKDGECAKVTRLPYCVLAKMVDHLIAHGVTIQKWISVEEGLPEPFINVLIHCPECDPLYPVHEGYVLNDIGAWSDANGCEIEGVTHWMPLPEPPKGGAGNG